MSDKLFNTEEQNAAATGTASSRVNQIERKTEVDREVPSLIAADRRTKVLLVTNIPTPYRIPLFNELHRQFAACGIDFIVVFAALGYARRKWEINMTECEFAYRVLLHRSDETMRNAKGMFWYRGLGAVLAEERPSVVITNGFSAATTNLCLRRYMGGYPYLIWSGAIDIKGSPDAAWRRVHRRMLVRSASGFIAYGTRAREYLVRYGADEERVHLALNTVDTDFFCQEAARIRQNGPIEGAPKRLLYVGNLEPGKRLDLLFRAIARLSRDRTDFVLEIVGSGSQEKELRQLAATLGVETCIQFLGFQQREAVAERLAQASCFVFPSDYDIWGLVLVEAMAAGLVCLASIHAGATTDLIRDGITGFALDFEDAEGVAQRLGWVLDHAEETRTIGDQAQRFIRKEVTLQKSAAGFVAGVQDVLDDDPRRAY